MLASDLKPVEASGKIYIRPDGSIDPPTAPIQRIGNIYRLTDNIYNNSIVVQRDGITLDGNGHLLQGFIDFPVYNNYGIYLYQRTRVTITNLIISDFMNGIWLDSSSNNEIIGNTLFRIRDYGIRIYYSDYNTLISNTVKNTDEAIALEHSNHNILYSNRAEENDRGINIYISTNNTLRNNLMVANKHNFYVGYFSLESYINDVDTSNKVDGKPIYYWINRHDETVPSDAGCIVIVNSTGITVKNLKLKNNSAGVVLAHTENSLIEDITATGNACGIYLDHSDYNTIIDNNVTASEGAGICLAYSHFNTVSRNFVNDTYGSGIWLEDTYYNTVINNNVAESRYHGPQEFDGAGVLVDDSLFAKVIGNTVTRNLYGIVVGATHAEFNLIVENDIVNNDIGLLFFDAERNTIYHNNFIENKEQVRAYFGTEENTFDAGYPSGGNFWSDHTGIDVRKGSGQDDPGSDGICDTPYVIDDLNQDRYPLVNLFGSPSPPTYALTITATAGGATDPVMGTYTYSQEQTVPVHAIPNTGYILDHWELDQVDIGTSNPVNVTMNSNHTLHAVFTLAYTLTITTTTGGTTNPTSGTYTYAAGTVVTVTATPDTDYYFDHWELDGVNYSNNPISVTMNIDHTLKAFFARVQYTLTVTATDGGTTDPTPGTYIYWSGTTVGIAALPNAGYYLDHWELDGIDIGIPNPVNVTMNANRTLHAVFRQLSSGHDVTIKGVTSKTVVGQGYSLTIKATVMNIGSYTETFNVTIYVNASPVASQSVTIESGVAVTKAFTWSTSGFAKGNYTISAVADTVPGETDVADNTFIDGWVIVSMVGDISGLGGVPDGLVDIDDVIPIALAFASTLGPDGNYWHTPPRDNCPHNPNNDITNDGLIDIDDVIIPAVRFGEIDP
jgi:parallel beta-helix repeat protein